MGLGIAFANIAHPVQTYVAIVILDYESCVTASRGEATAGRMCYSLFVLSAPQAVEIYISAPCLRNCTSNKYEWWILLR